ncbi:prepilin-type N-terminal cleavage/methylation domain-containing protein [Pseudomonas syringae pv. syringae]|uniref:type 4 pilus major pilin n=1 Tax=Pseudomonas syringae TaxID=317 RepID=UPI00200AC27B|nr:type 4 pilus major pilin [Pseudomonas syringae]MCK9759910.1 prepilin-type N-terminal cleavage/methylation domain-containing protein [Pseudomonas syringae pv. syringae]MCK9774901.1 prepilin-type N-terminal cleavage/methylation domain-containing protein [Pseudomonas syringae pv. syringae]
MNTQLKDSSARVLVRNAKTLQRGFGLPEMALVIVIIGLLAAIASMILPQIFANMRANKIIDELVLAVPNIQTAYQNTSSYNGLTTAQVAQNGWVGSGFAEINNGVPTGNLITQWGNMTFAPAANGAQGQGTINNVPSRECIKISNSFSNDQIVSATVNGTVVKARTNTIDLTTVGAQCSSSQTNTITFNFGRA